MSKEIATPISFEDKVKNLFRDRFADLITEEEMKALVEKTIKDVLLTSRTEKKSNHWDAPEVRVPSVLEQVVMEFHIPIIKEAVKDYLDANKNLVIEALQKNLGKSFTGIILQSLDHRMAELINPSLRATMSAIDPDSSIDYRFDPSIPDPGKTPLDD